MVHRQWKRERGEGEEEGGGIALASVETMDPLVALASVEKLASDSHAHC